MLMSNYWYSFFFQNWRYYRHLTLHSSGRLKAVGAEFKFVCRRCVLPLAGFTYSGFPMSKPLPHPLSHPSGNRCKVFKIA